MSHLCALALSSYVERDLLMGGINPDVPSVGGPGFRTRDVAGRRLLDSLTKKLADNVHPLAEKRALEKFLDVNTRCGEWTLSPERSLVEDVILGEFRSLLHKFWFLDGVNSLCDNPYNLLDEGRMGPGASMGVRASDFYTKLFSGRLTTPNSLLYSLYSHYVNSRQLWKDAEMLRHQMFGSALVVGHNRLSFVPKDNSICRTICTEPGLGMFFQLGLASLMERRLVRSFGLDLRRQQKINRALALRASLEDSLATIDLSSASDSISLRMLKWALPEGFYKLLGTLRSPASKLPEGDLLPLNMVSTMGNGLTFPLQTLLFTAVVHAVYSVMGKEPTCGPSGNWGVYGDDIICEQSCSSMVIKILGILGFQVNVEKSFTEGPFRESCGLDAYNGVDVRGVYLKEVDFVAPYVMFNRLNVWSSRTGIALPTTLRYLFRCAPLLLVPPTDSDSSGFKVPLLLNNQKRYDGNGSYIYYRYEPIASKLRFTDVGVGVPQGQARRVFNPAGVFLCYLGGYITNGITAVRLAKGVRQKFRRRKAVTPSWGYTAVEAAEAALDPARWQAACLSNFG